MEAGADREAQQRGHRSDTGPKSTSSEEITRWSSISQIVFQKRERKRAESENTFGGLLGTQKRAQWTVRVLVSMYL